jgi:hypothetical protein
MLAAHSNRLQLFSRVAMLFGQTEPSVSHKEGQNVCDCERRCTLRSADRILLIEKLPGQLHLVLRVKATEIS